MQTFDQIQAQIAQVQSDAQAKITQLQKDAAHARKEAMAGAIKQVKQLMAEHGLSAADLGFAGGKSAGKAPRKAPKAAKASGDKRGSVAPKYRDPATGQTWTGRGKSPTWMTAKLAAGATKAQFAI